MYSGRGYTLLVKSDKDRLFSHNDIMSRNEDHRGHAYSILRLGQDIVDLRSTSTYHMIIMVSGSGEKRMELEVPRTEPVLAAQFRPLTGRATVIRDDFSIASFVGLPWKVPDTGEAQILTMADLSSSEFNSGDIARKDGIIYLNQIYNKVKVLISEE
ncbi:hypothetical protein FJT64_011608 [Amphibalanus amphitrite]|uniref:Uncharacterized protein n=1 Tax=Amphibalanus amphitrite TaxID=1232801 RepID=A0A6A4VIK9_AMPAM|nr:hypothetical protein FJT64_011608 [Amphibalanus amphitrite]